MKPDETNGSRLYAVVGIPPALPDENFIWNNPSAAIASCAFRAIPLEQMWDHLEYIQVKEESVQDFSHRQFSGGEYKGDLDPASAIIEAVVQNVPIRDASELVVFTVPNHLDETGQDNIVAAFQAQGFFNIRLLWRPIAAALWWAKHHGVEASALADSDRALWVIDLDSRGLEVTRFQWQRHEADSDYVCPVRNYPRRDDYAPKWGSWQWAREVAQGLCGEDGSSSSLLWGVSGSEFQRYLEGGNVEPLVYQGRSDPRRWTQSSPEAFNGRYSGRWLAELNSLLDQSGGEFESGDAVLMHGWAAQHLANGFMDPRVSLVQVAAPDAIAEGAALFAARTSQRLPTYYDTLPQYAIWASRPDPTGQKNYAWVELNPESVVDAGTEWTLSDQNDPRLVELCNGTFRLARHIDRFSLLVQNKTLYDDDKRSNPNENDLLAKRLSVYLPTMTSDLVPLRLEMRLRPASGHARFSVQSISGGPVFGDRDSVDLSWKTAADEYEHKGYLEAREVVGRVMDKLEFREMTRLVTRAVQGDQLDDETAERLEALVFDYRKERMRRETIRAAVQNRGNPNDLLKHILMPWGYHQNEASSEPTRGLFGSRKEYNDPELDEIAQGLGHALLNRSQNGDWYKFLNYMFVYTPSEFVDRLRADLREGSGFSQIFSWNQVIAAGRVYDTATDFDKFILFSLESEFMRPDRSYTKHYWWSFFRCLCYHQSTAEVAPDLVYSYLERLCDYVMNSAIQQDERKYALHALLFALRLRETVSGANSEQFLPMGDPLVDRFNRLISPGGVLAGQKFPPTMLAGMKNLVKQDDDFSQFVRRFLNYRDDLTDRELGAGLATS
jgi:hypothetical protein